MDVAKQLIEEFADRQIVVPGERVVFIRDEKQEQQTRGGIIIPTMAQQAPLQGTLIALGGGMFNEDGSVRFAYRGLRPGQRICFTKYQGIRFEYVMRDGTKVGIESVHALDVYMAWEVASD